MEEKMPRFEKWTIIKAAVLLLAALLSIAGPGSRFAKPESYSGSIR